MAGTTIRHTSISWILIIYTITTLLSKETDDGCKLTKSGTEYTGTRSVTVSGEACIEWDAAQDESKGKYHNLAFPDGSRILAQNWCRNPRNDPKGPWCATADSAPGGKSFCDVPLCQISSCRVTGPGAEYFGDISHSANGERCYPWPKKENISCTIVDQPCAQCRNPDEDLGGPWCFVSLNRTKSFCDVPFCDGQDAVVLSTKTELGTAWSTFGQNNGIEEEENAGGDVIFSFRLWSASDWIQSRIELTFSANIFETDTNTDDINQWGSAVTVVLSNTGSAIVAKKIHDSIDSPGILQSLQWTTLRFSWQRMDKGKLSILVDISQSPINDNYRFTKVLYNNKARSYRLAAEVDTNNWVLDNRSPWLLSVRGASILWNSSDHCEEITAGGKSSKEINYEQRGGKWWLLRHNVVTFYVRTAPTYEACVFLANSPFSNDYLKIYFDKSGNIKIKQMHSSEQIDDIFISPEDSSSDHQSPPPPPLSFYTWIQFKLSIIKTSLTLIYIRDESAVTLINVTNPAFWGLRWFSISSKGVTHWTIYCDPSEAPSVNPKDESQCWNEGEFYEGYASVARSGKPCLPWTDKHVPINYRKNEFGSTCRNIDDVSDLPFCFTSSSSSSIAATKEPCNIPACISECRRAGTGADYTGNLMITRSGRSCQLDTPCKGTRPSLGGPSCPTGDPNVPVDFCPIPDCERPLECTIITQGGRIYMLPQWKLAENYGFRFWVKNWDPQDEALPLKVALTNNIGLLAEETVLYKVVIGENDKIMFYTIVNWKETLVQEKTVPRLITSSKWSYFYIKVDDGFLELGIRSGTPLIYWKSNNNNNIHEHEPFIPRYINFQTNDRKWIGISFICTECIVERTELDAPMQVWPLNLWKSQRTNDNDDNSNNNNNNNKRINTKTKVFDEYNKMRSTTSGLLDFYFNTKGGFHLRFLTIPNETKPLALVYNNQDNIISWLGVNTSYQTSMTKTNNNLMKVEYNSEIWMRFTIVWTEELLEIFYEGEAIAGVYTKMPLLIYWFSVKALNYEGVSWSCNCQAEDPGNEQNPRDGGWSDWDPWNCSKPCDGGEGNRTRHCNQPKPNILGKPCYGPETYRDVCNDFPCRTAPPEVIKRVRRELASNYTSLVLNFGESFNLSCRPNFISQLLYHNPTLKLSWTLNGFSLKLFGPVIDGDYTLGVLAADESDSGVYVCSTEDNTIILAVAAVVVKPSKYSVAVRRKASYELSCTNALPLIYIYGDLSWKWEHNGSVWKTYGLTTIQQPGSITAKIENINDSDAGDWVCVISQIDLGFHWMVQWTRINVQEEATLWSYLMEDKGTRLYFGWLKNDKRLRGFIIFLIFFIFSLLFCAILFYIKMN